MSTRQDPPYTPSLLCPLTSFLTLSYSFHPSFQISFPGNDAIVNRKTFASFRLEYPQISATHLAHMCISQAGEEQNSDWNFVLENPSFGLCFIFRIAEGTMTVSETPKKTGAPQIVKLDKALKLAESWVNNMSEPADDERTNADIEVRSPGLGLGAKVSRQSKVGPSNDPVERKLRAKLNAEKRKAANIAKESTTIARDVLDNEEDYEDEDSRTSSFSKRKAEVPSTLSILGNKKQK